MAFTVYRGVLFTISDHITVVLPELFSDTASFPPMWELKSYHSNIKSGISIKGTIS